MYLSAYDVTTQILQILEQQIETPIQNRQPVFIPRYGIMRCALRLSIAASNEALESMRSVNPAV